MHAFSQYQFDKDPCRCAVTEVWTLKRRKCYEIVKVSLFATWATAFVTCLLFLLKRRLFKR